MSPIVGFARSQELSQYKLFAEGRLAHRLPCFDNPDFLRERDWALPGSGDGFAMQQQIGMDSAVYEACTARVGRKARLDYWAAAFGSIWGDFDPYVTCDDQLYGDLRSIKLSALRVNRLSFKGMGIRRSSSQLRRLETPFYSLAFPVSGLSQVTMENETIELKSGHVYLLNNSCPGSLTTPQSYETLNVQIPVQMMADRLGIGRRAAVVELSGNLPLANILRGFVTTINETGPVPDQETALLLERQICDLTAFCFASSDGIHSEDSTLQKLWQQRATRYIQRYYANEHLSPQAIAEACGISVSYLHKCYRGTGRSVMDHVRDVRLEAAHQCLKSSGQRSVTISEIGYAVGFKSLSDFSRSYKQQFGCSPSQAR